MTKKNITKRALVASVLSLLLCVSMLVGSTFAWFTDSATTGVTNIQSGELKIDLGTLDGETFTSVKDSTVNFVKADDTTEILWEPGCTYQLPDLYVRNMGNLAFKYKVVITGIEGDSKLNEAIEWTIDYGYETGDSEGHMLGTDTLSKAITVSGHMKEEAGNEYQGLSITGITVTVLATQDTVEYDSEDNQYDADAEYPTNKVLEVVDDDTLTAAIETKKEYIVKDGNYTKVVVADAVDVTIEAGKFENQIIAARNGSTVTVKDANGRTGNSGQAVIANVNGGSTVIFEGGNYPLFNSLLAGDGTGTVIITGGYYDGGCFYWNTGTKPVANLTITGGTFGPNFMFTANMMGPSLAEFVPDTHQIINNTDGSCTVVAK